MFSVLFFFAKNSLKEVFFYYINLLCCTLIAANENFFERNYIMNETLRILIFVCTVYFYCGLYRFCGRRRRAYIPSGISCGRSSASHGNGCKQMLINFRNNFFYGKFYKAGKNKFQSSSSGGCCGSFWKPHRRKT